MTVDKLRFNLGNTNYDVPTKEYVDNLALNNGNNSNENNFNQSINLNDTPVGYITWQMALMPDYLKLDGTQIANASNDYTDLLDFAQDNNLITSDTTNKALFQYDEITDELILPDYISLVLQGGNTPEVMAAGLPNIKGTFGSTIISGTTYGSLKSSGAFELGVSQTENVSDSNNANNGYYMTFDASRSSSIYKNNVNTVQPPAITLIPQIKYRKDTSNNILYNDTPIGTIISYMGPTAPKDYLICDGTVYNIDDYKELAEFINNSFGGYNKFGGNGTTTFAVPDLRGEFLRGTGTNGHTNQGNGDSVGVHQDGTEIPNIYYNSGNLQINALTGQVEVYPTDTDHNTIITNRTWIQARSNSGTDTTYENTMSYTSRPTNTSVLYCIKYNTSVLSTPENNYSTEEQRIGTWIDGKPVYQKTYSGTTSGPQTILDNNMGEIEFIVNKSICLINDSYLVSDGYYGSTDNYLAMVRAPNGNLILSYASYYANKRYIATVQYTKTTD